MTHNNNECPYKAVVDEIKEWHFIDISKMLPQIIESKELTSPDLTLLQIIVRQSEKLKQILESGGIDQALQSKKEAKEKLFK